MFSYLYFYLLYSRSQMFEQFIDERLDEYERTETLTSEFDQACDLHRAANGDLNLISQAGAQPESDDPASVALKQKMAQLSTGIGSFSAAAGMRLKKSWKR